MLREESDEASKCGDELFFLQQKKRNLRSEVTYSICWLSDLCRVRHKLEFSVDNISSRWFKVSTTWKRWSL